MVSHAAKRRAMADKLAATTGRKVEEWAEEVAEAGVTGFMATVSWLKDNHGLGHFQARLIAEVRRDGSL